MKNGFGDVEHAFGSCSPELSLWRMPWVTAKKHLGWPKQCVGFLKRSGSLQIISMVKKKPFTTCNQSHVQRVSNKVHAPGYTQGQDGQMNCEVYMAIPPAQIQSNAAMIRWHCTVEMDNDLQHTAKARVSQGKEIRYSCVAKLVTLVQ